MVDSQGKPTSPVRLSSFEGGYFAGIHPEARTGSLYGFLLNGDRRLLPDPASRFQPQGPHGPSQVIDPTAFQWTDQEWRGLQMKGQILYELHLGTFTSEGTWSAAQQQLPELAELGITAIEVMPVADFAGEFGWGYDGVNLFAPCRLYGTPEDMRRFVNAAHHVGIGVILDVVYNHFGPDGNYLEQFASEYFTSDNNDWGRAINFDRRGSPAVREFFIANAAYWIDEFHLDGLRLDATQDIHDSSEDHILAAITRAVQQAGCNRSTIVVAENEPQDARLVRRAQEGGYGLQGIWNDDFHHTALVALTGRSEAYFSDYGGRPQEFISAVKQGFLYQGQHYAWQGNGRGTPTRGLPPEAFITFIQNHDQVANTGTGLRCHQRSSPGIYRALTALMLLGPNTPMLFQGQEFAASSPFLFFADHHPELAQAVRSGRAKFLSQFPSLATPEMQARLADPADRQTFLQCKLNFQERVNHAAAYAMHKDLLRLRRDDPVFRAQKPGAVDGAVLGEQAFVLRFLDGEQEDDRLLIVNLGSDLPLVSAPEPLLAPPRKKCWEMFWSSNDPKYGGSGASSIDMAGQWQIPGQAAVVLRPGNPPASDSPQN
jgi:maltooligosyltrehalose trehalohydrolase